MWAELEVLGFWFAVFLVVTQVILPAIFGKQTFWLFRKSYKDVATKENELAELRTQKTMANLDKTIAGEQKELGRKNGSRKP